MVRTKIRQAVERSGLFQTAERASKSIQRRRLGILYLQDAVLIMHTKVATHEPNISYAREMKNLINEVYGHAYIPSELPVLKYFQREGTEWHPVFVDWHSIHMSNKFLKQLEGHNCVVESIIDHEFEEPLLERLDDHIVQFIEELREKFREEQALANAS